jgi:hypothetical protein
MLALMTALMFTSSWNDAATSDDNVALISGYSYLQKQEYRLEPQNPPLIKDLAAVPLLFMDLKEPWDSPGWGNEDDPDTLGREFLYRSGNDADAILRAARAPMILFAAAFGALLLWWTRNEFGDPAGLLALFLYAFSPTFLAHGRFVATDVGAAAGFFLGVIAFLRFLRNPTAPNMLLAGLAMGFAFLTKFSTVALLPIMLLLAAAWVLAHEEPEGAPLLPWRRRVGGSLMLAVRAPSWHWVRPLSRTLARTVGIIAIAYLVVYPFYLHHVWNYAPEQQAESARIHRQLYDLHGTARDVVLWASDKPVIRPWAEYFLGLLVALKASRWGQPLFFFGEIYPTGFPTYFPVVYLLKEPLALHVLTLVALLFALFRLRRPAGPSLAWREWLREHFTEFAFLAMLVVYWTALVRSQMNIGVRHLLPAFPFMYILVAKQIVALHEWTKNRSPMKWVFPIALGGLLAWQAVSVLRVHPSYLAYFNEIAGGPDGGWRYVNDSNLDWGQDVKRLAQFVEARGIAAIRVSAFGPADPAYYLKERYRGPADCSQPSQGWVAVSAMIYPGAPWDPACDYRRHLPLEQLVAKIGYSIFVFQVD